VLQHPDQSRGRPQTYVKNNQKAVYNESLDMDFYASSILIDRQVSGYLEGLRKNNIMTSNYVRDLRYYVDMLIGRKWGLESKSSKAGADAIKEIVKSLPEKDIADATDKAKQVYESLGATDKAAKSTDM